MNRNSHDKLQNQDPIWPPPPENQSPPVRAKHKTKVSFQVIQIFIGIIVGTLSDYFLQNAGFDALVKLKLISLTDAFEGNYSHRDWQLLMDWCVFTGLLVGFLCLRRLPWFSYFTNSAFVTHCVIGGIFTFLLTAWAFVNPWG